MNDLLAAGALAANAGGCAVGLIGLKARFLRDSRWSLGFLVGAVLLTTTAILVRWNELGREPFQTRYETFVLAAWCIGVVFVVANWAYRMSRFAPLACLFAGGCLVAALTLSSAGNPLPPALRSPWFVPHVLMYFLAYAAMTIAFGISVTHLVLYAARKRPDMERFDRLVYNTISFAFPVLTAGLAFGAFWAQTAWGDYWGWDIKETWALISWLILALYFHLHMKAEWRGLRGAWLVSIGFAVVLVTYLGMEYLPAASESVHVYK